jgi:hypothetical protein
MNQQIKELAIECYNPYGSFDYEKFARLIVRECIGIVKPTSHHEAFAPSYLGDVDGLELLDGKVKQIKQHFGVENENI